MNDSNTGYGGTFEEAIRSAMASRNDAGFTSDAVVCEHVIEPYVLHDSYGPTTHIRHRVRLRTRETKESRPYDLSDRSG